jgi:hypothetical protein
MVPELLEERSSIDSQETGLHGSPSVKRKVYTFHGVATFDRQMPSLNGGKMLAEGPVIPMIGCLAI